MGEQMASGSGEAEEKAAAATSVCLCLCLPFALGFDRLAFCLNCGIFSLILNRVATIFSLITRRFLGLLIW